ncbi:MAG: hypothetical protein OEM81_04950 [Acidimicrobiia bacterium]|nr:hypothetical protein [Acidimicrobiia bacterium]MDH3397165.1 hypothetical protein [Acidimicrobiia bacterium]MDH5615958.1 hypothetical protein [Acidimicrobiia bacterium]
MAQLAKRNRITANAVGYPLGFVLLWAVLAMARSGTTFHLAPPLVALAAPLVYRIQGGTSRSTGVLLASVGAGLAVISTSLLMVAGFLSGPSLLPFGDAFVESVVGAVPGESLAWWWPVGHNKSA